MLHEHPGISEWTGGGTDWKRTDGRTNGVDYGRTEEQRLGSLKFEEGLLTAGDLTQKVVTAGSLTENREKQPTKEEGE